MDFRTAARRTATDLSSDMSMDPTMQDRTLTGPSVSSQPDVSTDGQDPATPGGPSPYNGVAPFGKPVVHDPEWLDPQKHETEDVRGRPVPHIEGPDLEQNTLHNARRHFMASESWRPEESPWDCTVGGCENGGTHYANHNGTVFKGGHMMCRDHAQQFNQFKHMFRNNLSVHVQQDSRFSEHEPRFDREAARHTMHNARSASYAAKAKRGI